METTTDPKKTFLNFRLAERLGRSLPMIRKGSLALIAQVLVSGMNFLLGLLLARWLVPAQYGAYTLAFSVFLVVASVHNALLLEPMGVLGPALFGQTLKSYVGKLIRIHFALAAGFVVVMAVGGLLISRTPHFAALSGAIAGACLATPWVLFLWFARQAAYLEMRPDIAAKGAITYAVAIALTIFALHAAGWLTPFGAFLALAAGSIVGGCFLLGVDGACVIGHGRSNRLAVFHALGQAARCVEKKVMFAMRERFKALHAAEAGVSSTASTSDVASA